MTSLAHIASTLPPLANKTDVVERWQRADDIMDLILKVHRWHAKDYDRIADRFWAGTPEKTARRLFDFIKGNIAYLEEPEETQIIMAPKALLYRRHGDCKHYASFINGVLDALKRKGYKGFEPVYRFSSYNILDKTPQHVFAVMKLPAGREIWIDPVLKSFDKKKRYYYHTDRKPMALYYMHGIPGEGDYGLTIGAPKPKKLARQQKRVQKLVKRGKTEKAAKVQKKQEFRNKGAEARKAERKSGKGPRGLKKILLKTSGLASRNAFLLLLKANVFRMATKIYTKSKQNPSFKEKIDNFWRNVGGNPAALWMNVQRGVNTYNKLHKKKKISGIGNADIAAEAMWGVWMHPEDGPRCIGAAPAAVGIAAAIAAAMPIIAKLIQLFKKEGVPTDGMQEGGDIAAEQVEQLAQDQGNGDMTSTEAVRQSMEEFNIPTANAPVNMVQRNDGSTDLTFPAETEISATSEGGGMLQRQDDPLTRGKDGITNTLTSIKDWIMATGQPWYKRPIVIVPVGVAAIWLLPKIINAAQGGTKRRRR